MPESKISVVLPVYNKEKFLAKCLEHLLHQTYKNIEIILVDDGSTDNSAAVYSKYAKKDKRIFVIKQKNAGAATARNNGLKKATGSYVHFMDADDYVNLDYYERMMAAASLTDSDVACSEVNEKGYAFPNFKSMEILVSQEEKFWKTRSNRLRPAWRFLFRKSFLEKFNIVFPKGVFVGEDGYFLAQAIAKANKVVTVPGAIYNVVADMCAETLRNQNIKLKGNGNMDWDNMLKENGIYEIYNANRDETPEVYKYYLGPLPILEKRKYMYKTTIYLFGKIRIGKRAVA